MRIIAMLWGRAALCHGGQGISVTFTQYVTIPIYTPLRIAMPIVPSLKKAPHTQWAILCSP